MQLVSLGDYKGTSLIVRKSSNSILIGTREGELLKVSISSHTIEKRVSIGQNTIEFLMHADDSHFWVCCGSEILYYSDQLVACRKLTGHDDSVIGLALHNNNLISASEDSLVKLWDLRIGSFSNLYTHQSPIIAFDYSPVQKLIATSCSEPNLIIYSLAKNAKISSLNVYIGKIWCLRFLGTTELLLSGDHEGKIVIRRTPDLIEQFKMNVHESRVKCISVSPDCKYFASCSFDKVVSVFDSDYKLVNKFEGHTDWIRSVAFGNDSNVVYSVGDDMNLGISEFKTQNEGSYSFWQILFAALMCCLVVSVVWYYTKENYYSLLQGKNDSTQDINFLQDRRDELVFNNTINEGSFNENEIDRRRRKWPVLEIFDTQTQGRDSVGNEERDFGYIYKQEKINEVIDEAERVAEIQDERNKKVDLGNEEDAKNIVLNEGII